uniref:Uncharacterized protein n=1 Tax=Aplanochytrium stocchinoi TaxID=215587 RepID=A0A7S3LJC5_9STRA|mmetsp:Transcript_19587/g.23817  ORF Transcript_19587/g.23817 Transcript_19587/m.23817 type:complete len:156 (-) Transcript_19587:150-617(-)
MEEGEKEKVQTLPECIKKATGFVKGKQYDEAVKAFSMLMNDEFSELFNKRPPMWRYNKNVLECLHRNSIAPHLMDFLPYTFNHNDIQMRMGLYICITSIFQRMIRAVATSTTGIGLKDLFMEFPKNTILKLRDSLEDVITRDTAMYKKVIYTSHF